MQLARRSVSIQKTHVGRRGAANIENVQRRFSIQRRGVASVHKNTQIISRTASPSQKGFASISINHYDEYLKTFPKTQRRSYTTDTSDFQEVTMPALSPTMEKGNIAKWRVQEGDEIQAGDVICEIETDKATLEFEAPEDGFVGKILVREGATDVPVGQLIALFTESKDDVSKAQSYEGGASSSAPQESASQPEGVSASNQQNAASEVDVDVLEVGMPALSPTMEKGNIAKWRVHPGDQVSAGDVLCEIETDKATLEFESPEDGIVGKILKAEGATDVAVGDIIAVLVNEEEDVEKVKNYQAGAQEAPAATSEKKQIQTVKEQPKSEALQAAPSRPSGDRVFASPLARKIARDNGIDINQIDQATGPNGRIIAADVEEYLKRPKKETPKPKEAVSQAVGTAQAATSVDTGAFEDIPTSNVRRVIAQRLQESKQTIPHYYLSVDVKMDTLLALRKQLNDKADGAYKLSVNDFIIKASALAMRDVPEANSSWRGDAIRRYKNVDISVAVQTDNGLITPIVKNAERLGVSEVSKQVKDLAARARVNKLSPEEYQGGTFTVSNLGMFGIKNFSAIINPPQACILAVGAAETRVLPKHNAAEGETPYEFGNFMSVTLSCDHRVVDGAVGAGWLKAFRKYIEDPMTMLL